MEEIQFNEEQRSSIENNLNQSIIFAGPGTGKTSTLIGKVAHLLRGGCEPSKIFCCTFSRKAANEMKQRMGDDKVYQNIVIGTIHSLCKRILEQKFKKIVQIERNTTKQVVKKFFDEKKFRIILRSKDEVDRYCEAIFKCEVNCVSCVGELDKNDVVLVSKILKKLGLLCKVKEFMKVFCECLKVKKEDFHFQNKYSFNDLLYETFMLFEKEEKFAKQISKNVEFVLVDEFQDLNFIQAKILLHLIRENQRIFILTDPNQSIYSWRESNYKRNIELFVSEYKDLVKNKFFLKKNYRNSGNILKVASSIIKFSHENKDYHPRSLVSQKTMMDKVQIVKFEKFGKEIEWIIKKVELLLRNGEEKVCILCRTNFILKEIIEKLKTRNMEFSLFDDENPVDGGFFEDEKRNVSVILNLLKFVLTPTYSLFCRCLEGLNLVMRRVSPTSIVNAVKKSYSIINGCEISEDSYVHMRGENSLFKSFDGLDLDNVERKFLTKFVNFVGALDSHNFSIEGLYSLYNDFDLTNGELNSEEEVESRLYFTNRIKERNIGSMVEGNTTIENFLKRLEKEDIFFESQVKSTIDKFVVTTIHKSKGLEFNHVFIPAVNPGTIPHLRSILEDDRENLLEEKRVFYVGVTRAIYSLSLSFCCGEKQRKIQKRIGKDSFSSNDFLVDIRKQCSEFVELIDKTDVMVEENYGQEEDDEEIVGSNSIQFYGGFSPASSLNSLDDSLETSRSRKRLFSDLESRKNKENCGKRRKIDEKTGKGKPT